MASSSSSSSPSPSQYLWEDIESSVADLEQIIAALGKEGAAVDEALKKFNDLLGKRTYLVHDRLSVADELMYRALHVLVSKWNAKTQQQFSHIVRWFDLVQHTSSKVENVVTLTTTLPETAELKAGLQGASSRIPGFPLFSAAAPAAAPIVSSSPSSPSSTAPAPASAPCSSSSDPPAQKQAPQNKNQKTASPSPSPKAQAPEASSSTSSAAEKPAAGGRNRGKGPAAPKPAPAPKKPVLAAPADYKEAFGRLNIVVGRIVSAAVHPNADTMYVEQIDLGEANPRQVVSGLRNFIPLEEFNGMKVLCLVNLKEAKLRQVSSAAMVLCASNPEHTAVEVLTIDDSVPIGERLVVPGFEGVPDESINPKHKVWELVRDSHRFIVGQDGSVQFESVPLQSKSGHLVKVVKSNPGDLIG